MYCTVLHCLDIQTGEEGESLYIQYKVDTNVVNGL